MYINMLEYLGNSLTPVYPVQISLI